MRVRLDQLVGSAIQDGPAVPALTCYDFTTALAVVEAAEQAGRGAILLVPSKTAATANGLRLLAALRGGLADEPVVPVAVQLDHALDLRVMADAVAAGADSVLADGSALPYEDNIALVLDRARQSSRRRGQSVPPGQPRRVADVVLEGPLCSIVAGCLA